MTVGAIVDFPAGRLRLWPQNPRRISGARLEQLKRALAAEPEMLRARPLIALPDGTVIAGNQRLRAARELGWESVPVVVVDLEHARAAEWALRDNRGYGEDDDALVGALLAELQEAGRDLALTGYDAGEAERLLAAVLDAPGGDADDAPPVPAEPRSRFGEVYELGPHRLACGDATDAEQVEELLGGALAEALWTDPPYGVSYVGKGTAALGIRNDSPVHVPALLAGAFAAADGVLPPGARFYLMAPPGPRNVVFFEAVANVGWTLHQELVWVKDSLVLGHSDYHYRHELILYGWKPGPGRVGRGRHTGSGWFGDNAQASVFEVPRPRRSTEHPTMKPIELIGPMLRNSTRRDDIVLDPFAGSGSTLIACELIGRRCYAIEIDPGYCDVIRQRYADLTRQSEYAPRGEVREAS